MLPSVVAVGALVTAYLILSETETLEASSALPTRGLTLARLDEYREMYRERRALDGILTEWTTAPLSNPKL
jgi:hypothetical protein